MGSYTKEEQTAIARGRNQVKAERAAEELLHSIKDILLWDRVMSDRWSGEIEVHDVRVKVREDGQDPYLVVVKGCDGEGTPVICFHSGGSVTGALASAARRLRAGNMKWKVDEWRANNE
jgi:hypothetical protein